MRAPALRAARVPACALALAAAAPATLGAQGDTVAYALAFGDPAAHLYEVTVDVTAPGPMLQLQMPVWSPGRYARMDFARNVQAFAAADERGTALRWDEENGSLWRVRSAGARRVRVRYRVFANDLSGTFSVLDSAHANWNGASLFMYVVGRKARPTRLAIAVPAGWGVYNGEARTTAQTEFAFPDYDHLIDTPTEVAPGVMVDSFAADERTYRVVVHHSGPVTPAQRERFVHDVRRLVTTENRVIAPPPLRTYTFLFNIGFPGGDGMEHLYSTQIISPGRWSDTAAVLPGISAASHEYFHTWNVKRIRPAALGPFDYTREQYQPSLWVAEGWTQYYGDMSLRRAGIVGPAALYATLAAAIRTTSEGPARKETSARMASFRAPFFDGAARPMKTDDRNTFLSYYTKGEVLALALDLHIRDGTMGRRSLDDVLRLLKRRTWDAPATGYYLQGRGYTERDVERAVSDVIGRDMHPWFERYVGGTDDLPWDALLRPVGLRLLVTPGTPLPSYRLEEDPGADAARRRLRDGWLTGTAAR